MDASGASAVIHLAGVSETELNAALTEPAALLVNVFIDGNSNGERGVYERRLAGVTLEAIRVTETGEAVAATALSDENGDASFTTLVPGTYKVRALSLIHIWIIWRHSPRQAPFMKWIRPRSR